MRPDLRAPTAGRKLATSCSLAAALTIRMIAWTSPACADEAAPPDSVIAPAAADTLAASADAASAEVLFPVPLESFATTMLGSLAARTVNVRLAAEALDGLVLEPGQVLSFNATVGARTLERGYQPAPVVLHETRQTQVGGGVCQVASTVFVAGLLSGLDVAERWRHTLSVDYIALGEDATIAWGAKDLKLRNTLGQRVRLRVRLAGAALSARFEAEEPVGSAFELERDERELPGDDDGAGTGREVELFRVRRGVGGDEDRELVHRDVIPPVRVRDSGSRERRP